MKCDIKTVDGAYTGLGLILDSDFQRGHVWTEEQQIAYLEYFLRGGKSGRQLFFNNPRWGGRRAQTDYVDFTCVDGLQRITAVRRFLHNEIPVFGYYRSEFEDDYLFTHDYIHMFEVCVNNLQTKEEVLQWYIEMNEGGTPHTKKEIQKVKDMLTEERLSRTSIQERLVLDKEDCERE